MMAIEEEEEDLLQNIQPPRLEDAGLEDCALPPDAIQEAFLKAAAAVRSVISLSDDDEDDPFPTTKDSSQGSHSPPPGGGDKVAAVGVDHQEKGDVPVVLQGDAMPCFKKDNKFKDDEEEKEEEDQNEKPVLTHGFV